MDLGHGSRSVRNPIYLPTLAMLLGVLAVLLAACAVDTGLAASGRPTASTTIDPAGVSDTSGTGATGSPTTLVVAGSSAESARTRAGLPDPRLTPGATNPAVTPGDVARTICRSGWSSSVRPPVSYTGTLKRSQIREYGYTDRDARHYQEDHLIPLSVGGAPRDPANLWPEPLQATLPDGTEVGAETKDRFELYLHAAVCDGSVPLRTAQRQMAGDWVAAWEAAGRP